MRKISRKKSNRENMIRNLVTSLILYESIETSNAKAKDVKTFCDHMISRARKADLTAIRYLNSVVFDRNASNKIVNELLPRFSDRNSGFVRIYKTENRLGDNTQMARVELVDKKVFITDKNKQIKNSEEIKNKSVISKATTRKSK